MIIDPSLSTFDDIRAALIAYADSKGTDGKWRDLRYSSAGMILIELIAGIGAYDAYRIGMAERNSSLDFAASRNAFILQAGLLGYPVNRNSAPILRLTVNAPSAIPFWDRRNPIGILRTDDGDERKLCLRYSQPIEQGVSVIDVYVGCWREWTYTSATEEDFTRLYVEDTDADNDLERFELTANDMTEIPLTHYAEALGEDNALVKTTVDGFFLQFGDGTYGKKLGMDDLYLIYLSTAGKLNDQVLISSIQLNIGVVNEVEILLRGYNQDSSEKIRTLSPGYFSTHRTMLSKTDHIVMTKSYAGDIVSADCRKKPDACCVVQVCPLFEDEHTPSTIEKNLLKEYLDQWKVAGEEIEIINPVRVGVSLSMVVVVNESELDDNVTDQIQDIVELQAKRLGETFYPGQVVRQVSQLPGVKRVYLHHPSSDRIAAFGEYVAIDELDVKLTTNPKVVVSHDPDNTGYSS